MKSSPHPLYVIALALLWPLITLAFVRGLFTSGSEFQVPNWLHTGLKPIGIIAYGIATVWIARAVVGLFGGASRS